MNKYDIAGSVASNPCHLLSSFNNIPGYVTPDEEVCFRGRNYCQGFQSTYDTVNERTNTNKRHKELDNFFYPQAFSFSSHHKIASTFILTDKPTNRGICRFHFSLFHSVSFILLKLCILFLSFISIFSDPKREFKKWLKNNLYRYNLKCSRSISL